MNATVKAAFAKKLKGKATPPSTQLLADWKRWQEVQPKEREDVAMPNAEALLEEMRAILRR